MRILGDWEEIKEESLNGDFFFFFCTFEDKQYNSVICNFKLLL